MKPRTKIQKEVALLFPKLPEPTRSQRAWLDTCHPHKAYAGKTTAWCSECCKSFAYPIATRDEEYVRCAHCGVKLRLQHTRKVVAKEEWYATIYATFHGWQVARHFLVRYEMRKGAGGKSFAQEVVQIWLNDKGQNVIVATSRVMNYYRECWTGKPMEIREEPRGLRYYSVSPYQIWSHYIYPHSRVLPIYKRNGFTHEGIFGAPEIMFPAIAKYSHIEELMKTKQYDVLRYVYGNGGKDCVNEPQYMHAIRICNRNGYIIKDASMWFDYIDTLNSLHLDTHNAHYVCPRNLAEAHDKMIARYNKIVEKQRQEEEKKTLAKWEPKYRKSKGMYFGIVIGNEKIVISVLKSVADVMAEGIAMHHCVYDREYYKKDNTLLLSARDKSGKRIETIELNTKTWKVVQSRGVCNKCTEYHDEILNLMNENIGQFKRVAV